MEDNAEFERDAATLAAADELAGIAIGMVGADAGTALIGAALKAWEREVGAEHAFRFAEVALRKFIDAGSVGTAYN